MWKSADLAGKGMNGIYSLFYATSLSSTQISRANGLNRQGIESFGICHRLLFKQLSCAITFQFN